MAVLNLQVLSTKKRTRNKFETCHFTVTAAKENKLVSRKSYCGSPSCRPRLRLGLQSLGLAQKDSLLLLMI
jgi:hypothetical protein